MAALTNRGGIYLKRKRYADAVAVFEQVNVLKRLAVDWWVLIKAEWLDQDPFKQ